MLRQLKRVPVAVLTFLIAVTGVSCWVYFFHLRSPQVIQSDFRWEPIYFKPINRTTDLANIIELRKMRLKEDDLEIRIWRGFGLSPLEAVFLRRVDGVWSATRIKTDDHFEPTVAETIQLKQPKSGWADFWDSLVEKGILDLPDASEINCNNFSLDGLSYVVELNHNNIYRTYMYSDGECTEAEKMKGMADLIGLEFDSGNEECKKMEWFACTKERYR